VPSFYPVAHGSGFDADAMPEKSAQKIFRAADQILRAGKPKSEDKGRDD
jgi:hypothetical protein